MILGIDLGTTHSLGAVLGPDGPRLIPNALGEILTPSVVGIDLNGEVLVGRAAQELQVLHPERCASVFKRHMGSDRTFRLVERSFTAEQLSTLVLQSLKADAERDLGKRMDRVVITVPAYFNDDQRQATIRAGRTAGFHVERIVNEPTAAAIAYGVHDSQTDQIAAVFDLGGGTFDISLVEIFEGAIEIRASCGECFLGGEDFTRGLAARLIERQGETFERVEMDSPKRVARLIQQCERAKRQLSRADSVEIRLPRADGAFDERTPSAVVTRAEFERWMEPILSRVESPVRRSLGDAKLSRHNIDNVILVGGATRMPMVIERVTQLFGREPQHRLNPDEVVALGAAVLGGIIGRDESLDDVVVTDVCPFTLGVEISKDFGGETRGGYFLPIIHRNTTIPVSRVERVQTISPNQTEVRVRVFQGESRKVEGSLSLGEFVVRGIPRGPSGQSIDIRFTYDLNGVLEVEATVVETESKHGLVIAQHARGLSAQEIAEAVTKMADLKHHPREDAVNRFLLKRAERLFEELPRGEREELTRILDGFESSLDRQDDAATIGQWRDLLSEFLKRVDGGEGSHDES